MLRVKIGVVFLFLYLAASAQQKRPLTHEDYDGWESISSEKITKDGQWVGFEINPQDGDGRLEVVAYEDPSHRYIIPRVKNWKFSHDSKFAFGEVVAQKDSIRQLKLQKVEKKDLPKDSLFILDLASGQVEKLARVKSYAFPKKAGSWLAVHFEKESDSKDNDADSDSSKVEKDTKKKGNGGTRLTVLSLDAEKNYEFDKVKHYGFSEKGDHLFYVAEDDSLSSSTIRLLHLQTGESKLVDSGQTDYVNPVISQQDKYLAFLATADSAKAERPYFGLYLYDISKGKTQKIAEKGTKGILPDGMVSEHGSLFFSENETSLFFGTAPDYRSYAYEEDSTLLDEERVNLDIWGWQDSEIQPMQLKNRSSEEKRSFLAVYDLKGKELIQIGDEDLHDFHLDKKNRHRYALGFDDSAYRRNYSWDIQIGKDVYLVDLQTGTRELIQKNIKGSPVLSPAAQYAYWYDNQDSTWMAYHLKTKTVIDLTGNIATAFYDELHDSPSLPRSYGSAGWLADDEAFLVYDRFDLWSVDPSGKKAPINLTLNKGRELGIVFRRERLDPEETEIDPKKPLILNAFHERNKRSGYYKGDMAGKEEPKALLFSDHHYFGLAKAEESDELIVRRSTYQAYSDVYTLDRESGGLGQLSFANPQQDSVKWGSVELVDYLANDGTPLQGLLFKPEGFDPERKYPMMVYFYERSSDGLHAYRAPVPSASIINIPFFVSNDYLVFVPDIKYELGLPGPSAYNCVIPGVQSIIAQGFVDKENMAIQGQSWGGYQVAHLITRTDMFKAAGAGAPVVNMTSAYGGIRWGTGMSRMFQYEQTQSRIGGTLWEKPLYYIENSPLFFMDRVDTPVLIMHNDEDGAVPWYQGIEMFMALKRLNKPAWLLQYNGEDHNLRERKNRKDLSIRLSQFFDHYLKGAPAPLWMTEGLPAVEKGRTLKYELEE